MTLMSVHQSFLFMGTKYHFTRLKTSFGDAPAQWSSHHNVALVEVDLIVTLEHFFLLSTHQFKELTVLLLCYISPPLDRCH